MRTIQVEEDLYQYLVSQTQEIGESASSIIRRLIRFNQPTNISRETVADVFDFLKDPQFRFQGSAANRFLYILGWAYRKHPQHFENVITIQGRKRRYFAKDAVTLIDSGESVNPRQIPGTPFWVVTNNSTAKKSEILSEVFKMLGYETVQVNTLLHELFAR